jgi:hypothetical protein
VKKYVIKLTEDEREYLYKLISAGSASARMRARMSILLKTDVGKHSEGGSLLDGEIAPLLLRPPRPRCSVFAGRGAMRRSNAR